MSDWLVDDDFYGGHRDSIETEFRTQRSGARMFKTKKETDAGLPFSVTNKMLTLYENAKCTGMDPAPFDAVTGQEVLDALNVCASCPVRDLCTEVVVDPQGEYPRYTGVAGGRIWVDGVDQTDSRKKLAVIRWTHVEQALTGAQYVDHYGKDFLTRDEKRVAIFAGAEMGLTTDEVGKRIGMLGSSVRRMRRKLKINAEDHQKAEALGARLRESS